MAEEFYRIRNLTKVYKMGDAEEVRALNGVDMEREHRSMKHH